MPRGYGHTPYGRRPYGDPFYLTPVIVDAVLSLEPDADLVVSYTEVAIESLPPGPLWDADRDEGLYNLLTGLAREKARAHDHLQKIVLEANPGTMDETLPEWEAMLGLPDDCAPPTFSREARKAAVRAAFLAAGGQNKAYIESLIYRVFGVEATLTKGYKVPFTTSDGTGSDIPPWSGWRMGDEMWDYSDWFEWKVTLTITTTMYEGSDLYERLICLLNRIKPAWSTVVVEFVVGVEA